ncbi:hypothetical protein RDI58_022515 [Solanum bulbocastanum]|uniref:Uncharacterized protein n=1 Tax=Solanum bulbocastanum TaxID=147425 RepID=A0AAN8T7W9_SOLBU
MTFVYASNGREERKGLWSNLTQIGVGIRNPWAILGDFNAVLHSEDRLGGNPVTLAEVAEFEGRTEKEVGLKRVSY